jgi:hypothetical protein
MSDTTSAEIETARALTVLAWPSALVAAAEATWTDAAMTDITSAETLTTLALTVLA